MAKKFQIRICQKHNNFPKNFQVQNNLFLGMSHPFPFNKTLSSVFVPFLEQDWMIFPQISFQLPSGLLRTKVLLLHLYLSDDSVPKCYFSLVQNTQGFFLEFTFWFHLNQVPIDHMSRVMNILLQQRNMKYIMKF
jgi:hypothetical protein